jgi:hypothetical protein
MLATATVVFSIRNHLGETATVVVFSIRNHLGEAGLYMGRKHKSAGEGRRTRKIFYLKDSTYQMSINYYIHELLPK